MLKKIFFFSTLVLIPLTHAHKGTLNTPDFSQLFADRMFLPQLANSGLTSFAAYIFQSTETQNNIQTGTMARPNEQDKLLTLYMALASGPKAIEIHQKPKELAGHGGLLELFIRTASLELASIYPNYQLDREDWEKKLTSWIYEEREYLLNNLEQASDKMRLFLNGSVSVSDVADVIDRSYQITQEQSWEFLVMAIIEGSKLLPQ